MREYMKTRLTFMLLLGSLAPLCAVRSQPADSVRGEKVHPIAEVVVTGTRNQPDIRQLGRAP